MDTRSGELAVRPPGHAERFPFTWEAISTSEDERRPPVSGHGGRGTPGPIPNPEAKPPSADGTAGEARGRAGRR